MMLPYFILNIMSSFLKFVIPFYHVYVFIINNNHKQKRISDRFQQQFLLLCAENDCSTNLALVGFGIDMAILYVWPIWHVRWILPSHADSRGHDIVVNSENIISLVFLLYFSLYFPNVPHIKVFYSFSFIIIFLRDLTFP